MAINLADVSDQAALDAALKADVDAAVAAAVAQFAGFDDLKAKADQFDASESEKLDDLQRAQIERDAATARAEAAELSALRLTVASAKGVPAGLLAGDTKETLEAAADALLEFRGEQVDPNAPRSPRPNPQQGSPGDGVVSAASEGSAEADKRFGAK